MKKILLISFAVFLLVSGTIYLLHTKNASGGPAQKEASKRPPVEVSVHTVQSEKMVFTTKLPGRTSAYKIAEIRPQVSGIIVRRMFTEGSKVQKGQQLYQIDSAMYQAAYDKALAGLAQIQANMTSLEPRFIRYQKLLDAGGVSRQEYDDAAAALAQAKAGIAMARAQVAEAKINLDRTRILAPISGRIGRSHVTEGALVTTGQAMALAVVQDLDQIYVDVRQSSQDTLQMQKQIRSRNGAPKATLLISTDDETYPHKGRILFSDITVDETTDMVRIRILFPNPENVLLPGLFVKARIELSRQDNAIGIPQQAVIRSSDGQAQVWLVDEQTQTVNFRTITISQALENRWLVTSGLKPGDRIVVEGLQKIQPMTKVSPVEAPRATI